MSNERPRFIKLADDCVRDTLTGLEWTPTLNLEEMTTFSGAKEIVANCKLLGGGWQVPDPHQLQSIVDYNRFDPAIDTSFFPDTPSHLYWTGQKDSSPPSGCVWVVLFGNGFVGWDIENGSGYVRAVRRSPGPSMTDILNSGHAA